MRNPRSADRAARASNRLTGQLELSTPNTPQPQLDDDGREWAKALAIAAANWLFDRGRR